MLFNKNFYRKAGDKKVLHKVGKQWKVVSVALLMALGGGAAVAATNNANANADATDNAYNDAQGVTTDTAAQATALENNNYYGGSAKASVAPKSAAKSVAAPKLASINYAPSARYEGNNASAASYKNNESYDNANINYYGPIVSGYVDQINAQYPQARSLEDNYNNLSGKTANARSAANSYSATAQNSNTAYVISSMASATNQTASNFVDSVAYNVLNNDGNPSDMGYMPKVSYTANEASQDSVVASYANLIYDINNNPALSAEYKVKAGVAKAKANVARDYASNAAKYVKQLNTQSEANNNALNDNINNSIELSGQEEIAQINSSVDAQFVSSAASNAGFKYSSSVVSSAVSAIASEDNENNNYNFSNYTVNYDSASNASSANNGYFNNQVAVHANDIEFTANNEHAYSISLGSSADSYAHDHPANTSAVDFIQVVSDTAIQSAYDHNISGLNSSIAAEKANVASYANALSSANDTLAKAKANLSNANSVAAADAVLANKPNDAYIFSSVATNNSVSAASYDAAKVGNSSEVSALSEFGNLTSSDATTFYGNNASASASSEVASAQGQVAGAIKSLESALKTSGQSIIVNVPSYDKNTYGTNVKTSLDANVTAKFNNVSGVQSAANSAVDSVVAAAGSAATVKDVLTTSNAQDGKQFVEDVVTAVRNYIISANVTPGTTDVSTLSPTYFTPNKLGNTTEDSIADNTISLLQSNNGGMKLSDMLTDVGESATTNTSDSLSSQLQGLVSDIQNAAKNATSTVTGHYASFGAGATQSDKDLLADAGVTNLANNNDGYTDVSDNASSDTTTAVDNAINSLTSTNPSTGSLASLSNVNASSASKFISNAQVTSYEAPILNASDYSAAYNDFGGANGYLATKGDFGYSATSDASSVASYVASFAASVGSNYNSVSSASASYAKATDQDVTIASQFNSYYGSIASSDATLTASAKASLDDFRATHASNPEAYASASDAYANAVAAKPNDRDFAYAYGKNVLINTPEYITVKKNAMLHSDTQYAKKNSVESVKAGTQFAVKGVGFDLVGNVRYVVADAKGKNLYITANDQYVRNTYLAPSVDYTVTLDKDAVAHSTLGFVKDAKGTIPAGTQLEGYTVPTSTSTTRRDAAYGVTRLQVKGGKFNGYYITTNGKYFSNVTENSSNNAEANAQQNANPVQNTINFAD